jgi:TusE/DsrC/DsvC family sulfur relay protein
MITSKRGTGSSHRSRITVFAELFDALTCTTVLPGLPRSGICRDKHYEKHFVKGDKTMGVIKVQDKTLEVDGDGFLANTDEWNPDVAEYLAAVEGIQMTEHHWAVVDFLRDYYKQYKIAPMIKLLAKELGNKLGSEKGKTKYLYALYPAGPAKQACKIAGLPKSTSCV